MSTVDSQTKYQWQKSSENFSARITRVDDSPDESEASAELEVLEVWKGPMPGSGHITVAVAPKKGGMSCAYRAVVGQELIVYSSLSPPRSLSSCAISTLSDRSREKRLLDKWRKRDAKKAARRVSE